MIKEESIRLFDTIDKINPLSNFILIRKTHILEELCKIIEKLINHSEKKI
jgi:hypothetical protein